ncbi:hypothetical protein O181_051369 [Austropuccinia psidii MF-1]|uniref:Integrase catalytic domain-containing protein n=1 Tax=Austropuccinia psidii MF-1 TaxID=1389203 RepID=A0A9Q3DYK8_9BASI|nr:hypothetical protein [Austropuccinia psidii MF-1]
MFLPYHKDDIAMDTAIMISNKAINLTGLFQNIISDRDPKFTLALCTNLHNLFGTKLYLPTAHHPQTDGLAERMILTLEDMIRGFAGKTPAKLEKGWSPTLPYNTVKNDLVDICPIASSFKLMLEKARHHANTFMQDSIKYANERWDNNHKPPDLKIRHLVLVSTPNFKNIKGSNKLKDSFAGPFMIKALHGPNAVRLELTGELMNKHPTFPVCLIKPFSQWTRNYFH